jgi:alkanesulfonate monooxygenase SsuD/methylene tetrahydromethanopterin reductase-like flavin-dependent oxidoreductase (luciferase family)
MALDDLSGGRFLCGVGAGATGFDAAVLGHDLLSPAARIDRLTEFVELLDLLLTSDDVACEGGYYTARDARTLPRCVRRPRVPLLVAGTGPRGQRLALRLGDGWITNGPRDVRSEGEWWSGLARLARAMDASQPPDGVRRLVSLDSCPGYSLSSAARFEDMASPGRWARLYRRHRPLSASRRGLGRARGDAGADRPLDDRGGSAQDVIGGPRAARSVPS